VSRTGSRGMSGPVRWMRYGLVSVVAVVLAQAGLLFAYGVLRWSTTAAVAVSLAVSIVPAYELNRRLVWRAGRPGLGQALQFVGAALAGSAVTALATAGAARAGASAGFGHVALTVTVGLTALLVTGAVWVARFWFFDRVVFRPAGPRAARRPAAEVVPR
jgi:putative flippase GtrA